MYPSKGPDAHVYETLTDGATVSWNLNDSQVAKLTLGGNRTLALSEHVVGGSYLLKVIQDGTGSRLISSYGSNVKWAGGTAPTLSTAAGSVDLLKFVSDGTYLYGSVVGKAYA